MTLLDELTARADRIRAAHPVALATNIDTGELPNVPELLRYLIELNREAIAMVLVIAEAVDELQA